MTKCIICDKDFKQFRVTHLCCSKKCNKKNQYELRKDPKVGKHLKQCVICNKNFLSLKITHICCSKSCNGKLDYINKKQEYLKRSKHRYNMKKKHIQKIKRVYEKKRRKNDMIFMILCRLRARTCQIFDKNKFTKNETTKKILGCDNKSLFEYIENKFIKGMSWDNREKWHIDHIIPLSSAKSENELYQLCHYTNLQPLWAEDNLKKSNKMKYVIK